MGSATMTEKQVEVIIKRFCDRYIPIAKSLGKEFFYPIRREAKRGEYIFYIYERDSYLDATMWELPRPSAFHLENCIMCFHAKKPLRRNQSIEDYIKENFVGEAVDYLNNFYNMFMEWNF
jgi:hypothetical protein